MWVIIATTLLFLITSLVLSSQPRSHYSLSDQPYKHRIVNVTNTQSATCFGTF